MKITKEWIEKVIRHNRPGIAAAQIMQEIEESERAYFDSTGYSSIQKERDNLKRENQELKNKTDKSEPWESPRERVFRLGRNI